MVGDDGGDGGAFVGDSGRVVGGGMCDVSSRGLHGYVHAWNREGRVGEEKYEEGGLGFA